MNTPHNETENGGEVVWLPSAQHATTAHEIPTQPGTAIEPTPEVLDGELVSEAESADVDRRIAQQHALTRFRAASAQRAVVIARQVQESDTPKTVGKAVVRHALYVPAGAGVVARKVWEAKTNSRYERQMRAAEAAGDLERLADWEQRAEQAKERRHRRTMEWIDAPGKLVNPAAIGAAAIIGILLAIGVVVAVAVKDGSMILAPIKAVIDLIKWIAIIVSIVWGPLILAAPWLFMAFLWDQGRRKGTTPGWLVTSRDSDPDLVIDERTITQALKAMRIPAITAYLKDGLPMQYLTAARKDGRGTHAVLRLPAGVTAEQVARRRAELATGLHRQAKEVWPTTGSEAGILDLWVADKGALAEGAGPYPLLEDGRVDVFKGVPFGKTLRGEPILAPLMERNTITGGMPGQGKSSAARVICLGAALDPTAELRIWVPDSNFDFEAFTPRCSRYVMGAKTEKIAQILDDLRELHTEVQARGELLIKFEEPSVNRVLASKNVGLHPLVCLLEEAHVAIQHPDYGKEIAQLLIDIVKLGRKRGIHLIVSTQAPTKDSMPRDVTRNCSNGIAFAVGDHTANDGLLGQGAYSAGHRATELIPGTDRGTAVVKGFSGQRSEMVQAYFVSISREYDQVTPIIQRAITALNGTLPGQPRTTKQVEQSRDLLEDLDAALGGEVVPIADVPALLRDHAPGWAPYARLTGVALRKQLAAEYGIKVPSTGNKYPLDPAAVRARLAEMATTDLDTQGE